MRYPRLGNIMTFNFQFDVNDNDYGFVMQETTKSIIDRFCDAFGFVPKLVTLVDDDEHFCYYDSGVLTTGYFVVCGITYKASFGFGIKENKIETW